MSDATITRYLLGNLEEQEQDRLEQQYFTDPELLALVEATEDDLIDAYIRGELSAADRARFESHFLRSRRRRERVKTAEALLARLPSKSSRAPVWFAFAAALALMFALWRGEKPKELPVAAKPAPVQQQVRQQVQKPAPQIATVLVTLILTPGVTRGEIEPPRLDLRQQVDTVVLEPVVEGNGPFSATIRIGERELWSAMGLARGNGHPLRVQVPAPLFATGDHLLTLRDASGEIIDDYLFFVIR
ncbi:MAG TPA: zf-HC2 domain-containing protein [Thermoanaerobaculia bacterium]|jgi:anti-sigma factor RsiW